MLVKIRPTRSTITLTRLGAAAVAGLISLTGCSIGLSGSSTCADYMNAGDQQQRQVVSQLASKHRKGVWATPMGFPGVAYYCASHPSTTLDEFFESASNY